jgi:organic hydroperoxide reductase OsmC/OhrA
VSDPARVHRYTVSSRWRGSTGAGYEAYDRSHDVEATPGGVTLALSSDPAFRGDATRLNPEQLLVMAASSCQLLSFLAVAARARIDVIEYREDAEGEMPEDDPPMRITRITLRPRITIRGDVDDARVRHLVEVAHRECFIANSLTTKVIVQPEVVRQGRMP